MGVSHYLKEKNTDIQVIGVQPTEGSSIPGIRRWPKEYLPGIFDAARVDKTIDIDQQAAEETTRQLNSVLEKIDNKDVERKIHKILDRIK